ncbi:M56 family metallopeptidase [Mariniflexile jejuense]|uniref:M56 family metallopeptidase n=1 Tax=Mariniflexile jejuense TaxID=1173582 RepID=A0ABW3JIT0_9FLAO
MAYYILQVIAFQLAFLLIYDMFLKSETFFNWNRFYLIATALLSIAIPFIRIDNFKNVVPQKFIINLPEVIIGTVTSENQTTTELNSVFVESKPFLIWENILLIGIGLATILFVFKTVKLLQILLKSPKSKAGNLVIVKLLKSDTAFSFFNYIFLGEYLMDANREAILKHEIVHVRQKHTLDLLFFEMFRILFWFNPLVYMYKNRMMSLHEFIADAEVVKHQDKASYYQNLLSQVFETKNISFINPFFKQSLIKKRIVMLTKSKSKQVNLLKYALLIPMVFGMLVYTSCMQNAYSQNRQTLSEEKIAQNSPLIEKIKAIGKQLQAQGNTSEEEDKGLNLLLRIIKQNDLDTELVKEVQTYTSIKPKTKLTEKICDVFNQIQKQGDITDAEDKTLKKLLVFTSDDGFNDPFFDDVINDVDVPFGVVDQVPVFPGCESLETNADKKVCMSKNIQDHVAKNFNTKIAEENNLVGRQRINVIFKIDIEGNITEVRSRAPHPALEAEAIRVIKSLPKMIPGEQKGKKVNVPYSLPIIFQVTEDKPLPEKE